MIHPIRYRVKPAMKAMFTAGISLFLVTVGCTLRPAAEPTWMAATFSRRTIYHSPQTPGYTCWVGAWQMPDKSLMVTFKQATGPVGERPRSRALLEKMGLGNLSENRDFTGLRLVNVYLRSTDRGATWTTASEEEFSGPFDRPSWGGSHCALSDGSLLRAIDGSQLPTVPNVPRQIYFQRSMDLGRTWGEPEVPPEPIRPIRGYLGDYGDCISRVRRVSGRRLMATGVVRPDPRNRKSGLPLVMFSADDGKTWQRQKIELTALQQQDGAWNEWDCAELANGDFLCIFRRVDPDDRKKQVRWQGTLTRRDDHWTIEDYFPASLAHSGHPELLASREGIILHLATTGTHWNDGEDGTWHSLERSADNSYRTHYYPRSIQTEDGTIFVFSHIGADDGYGQRDQAIVMDVFSLKKH
jgi:hypothetical protein